MTPSRALADRGGNEMGDFRCSLDQPMNVVLQHAVRVRHPFVLAQMLEPRLDDERLEESVALGDVLEDSPRVRAIPSRFAAGPLDCGAEPFPLAAIDAMVESQY